MCTKPARRLVLALSALAVSLAPLAQLAGEPLDLLGLVRLCGIEHQSGPGCRGCGAADHDAVECVEVIPVEKWLPGKKKDYQCRVRYEWVTVPETQYRWTRRWVSKEIPCQYCKPVCKTDQIERITGVEQWDEQDLGGSQLHCRTCEPKTEKVACKQCQHEPGQTTIKVHYWTSVKEPYTVYRQVKRPVCVKQARSEPVTVPVTTHVSRRVGAGAP